MSSRLSEPSTLVWFRRDLRGVDHAPLYHARRRHRRVFCAFVFDTDILDALPDRADRRVEFIRAALSELDAGLAGIGRAAGGPGGGPMARRGCAVAALPRLAPEGEGQTFPGNQARVPASNPPRPGAGQGPMLNSCLSPTLTTEPTMSSKNEKDKMTPAERRVGASLASIFALRMLGLFLILPVFAPFAQSLPGGTNMTMVGLAIGAYGLTQAFFQLPFGAASDRFGRKPVIAFGLLLFAAGSVVAALTHNLLIIIAGRVLQGSGAISAAVTALAADLTREQHRTKVMAMIGSSIGLVFAGSLVAAPLLYSWVGMSGLFWLTGALALVALGVLFFVVPEAPPVPRATGRFSLVLKDGQLMRLNFGVFALHLMQTSMWVLIPPALVHSAGLPLAEHWKVYLPAVLMSFVVMVPAVIVAEKHAKMKEVFMAAIALLLLVQVGLYLFGQGLWPLSVWLTLFFVAFNVLEATQPSWISRIAPPHAKGTALGVYNTLQSCGLFLGGVLGGWLTQHLGPEAVSVFCGVVALAWLLLASSLQSPRPRVPVQAEAAA